MQGNQGFPAPLVARDEDGTYSWKFDPWLNICPVLDMPEAEVKAMWEAITCPILLFYGADSWASNPAEDGRLAHFQNAEDALLDRP
ncbi:pimeloyl-ACP methyl ester carboxylesterase [Novosphingobium sp. SG707]|nr:pimeloyl-ACP methyl ester carboxylesterase [Novosphingobium sp. SG707]